MKPASKMENVNGKAESERLSVRECLVWMRRGAGRAVRLRRAVRLQPRVPVRWGLRLQEGEVTADERTGSERRWEEKGRRAPGRASLLSFMRGSSVPFGRFGQRDAACNARRAFASPDRRHARKRCREARSPGEPPWNDSRCLSGWLWWRERGREASMRTGLRRRRRSRRCRRPQAPC
jgi:hypothetical protein